MKTVVITTGGLGTRLLTYTKISSKAMIPLFDKSQDMFSSPLIRPLIEMIFENLYDHGFRRFCFIVGTKSKKSIYNHLLQDNKFLELLKKRDGDVDKRFIRNLKRIDRKINNCEIKWITQPTPMGFGHALLSAKNFVKNHKFLLHAGDVYFPSYDFLDSFIHHHIKTKSTGTLLLQQQKILKGFGIAQIREDIINTVFNVEEKPNVPKSNLVILPIYVFNPKIFTALKQTIIGHNNELQITDAVKTLMNSNEKISSQNFLRKKWFDIGTPENYFHAFNYSYKMSIIK